MAAEPTPADLALWARFVKDHAAAVWARHRLFLAGKPGLPGLVRRARRGPAGPAERNAAEEVAGLLEIAPPDGPGREPTPGDEEHWARFVAAHAESLAARRDFLERCGVRSRLVGKGLNATGEERSAALDVAADLDVEERKRLLPDLVALAGYAHGQTLQARALILSLPRDWLLHHLEPAAEPLLDEGTDEEYRATFALYRAVDRPLAHRLAERAAAHADPDIHACADDFFRELRSDSRS